MALIFVSYRRDDSQSATGRLCDKLQTHFGDDQVFHDIESIEPGTDFTTAIASKVAASAVVLVMIGRHWISATSSDGRQRLFDPDDYVRLEIATALQRSIPVIPVLIEGAAMPPASSLPEPIAALVTRHAHEISAQRWQYDSDRLVTQLESFVPAEGTPAAAAPSTLPQMLLRSVAAWPLDFIQVLMRPRRQLAALVKQPDAAPRAAIFFALAHLVAAWAFVPQDLVASVPVFVLTGVPIGASLLLLVAVPLHLAARLVRAPSHALSTMVMLGYMQSVAMVLVATGVALLWAGLVLVDPEVGPKLRAAALAPVPIDVRLSKVTAVTEATMGGPFLASFALANVIWLYTAGWLVVASNTFRDRWRISGLRAAAIVILVLLALAAVAAAVAFAATRGRVVAMA